MVRSDEPSRNDRTGTVWLSLFSVITGINAAAGMILDYRARLAVPAFSVVAIEGLSVALTNALMILALSGAVWLASVLLVSAPAGSNFLGLGFRSSRRICSSATVPLVVHVTLVAIGLLAVIFEPVDGKPVFQTVLTAVPMVDIAAELIFAFLILVRVRTCALTTWPRAAMITAPPFVIMYAMELVGS